MQSRRAIMGCGRPRAQMDKGPGEPPRDKYGGDEQGPDHWAVPGAVAGCSALRLKSDFLGYGFRFGCFGRGDY